MAVLHCAVKRQTFKTGLKLRSLCYNISIQKYCRIAAESWCKMFELLSTEKDYYRRLTEDERRIYTARHEQLAAIDTWNDFHVRSFVEVSRLLNELHRIHERYNDMYETYCDNKHPNVESMLEENFNMTMAIGLHSAVFRLGCMDECDALYGYLATIKMNRFDQLCDNFDIGVLIETLVSHECYI
jgi:hypothetical protein